MRKLEYQLKLMLYHNRDGSYATQAARRRDLLLTARDLRKLGFNQMNIYALKEKHVLALVKYWQSNGLSVGTQKNKLSYLRWWARKIGKPDLIPEDNRSLAVPKRRQIPSQSKAQYLQQDILGGINNERIRHSIELQQEFGLRRLESLLFSPSYADQRTFIKLKGSWTKGGRPRDVPITNSYQRTLLNRVHKIAGRGSMIPCETNLRDWLLVYRQVLQENQFRNLHGLRHGYAQRRYATLSGWPAPFAGGPKRSELTRAQRARDDQVRLQVSRELGHNRIDITSVYLGK